MMLCYHSIWGQWLGPGYQKVLGVVIYEAMTPNSGRSVDPVLVVRVDIGVVTNEAMTPQCGSSSVIYEAMTS